MIMALEMDRHSPAPAFRRAPARLSTPKAFASAVNARLRRARGGGSGFAVLRLALDQADAVSEALGPLWREALLEVAAGRISACLRPGDAAAAMDGGFALLLDRVDDAADAVESATRVQRRLGVPFALGGQEVFATASVGIALGDGDCPHAQDLLRDAHAAMGAARARGPGLWCVFRPAMRARAVDRLRLEASLRRALERREFELCYQPLVSLESGRPAGFEALLRWRHPERGLLAPAEFLAEADACGVMVPVGRWVLAEACRQVRAWEALHPGAAPATVAVNLSARQLRHPGIVADVEDALAAAELAGNRLHLEITEGAVMENGRGAVETLCRLKALGVRLSIDDFGVGYSSLSYLHRFPVDVLKVDRSFVAGLGRVSACGDIVRAIVGMAHGLGLDVVAEGVETAEHLAQVRALECDYAQGYLFSHPVTGDQAGALLGEGSVW
jgi:EAL domain-containing protein (putative c-di-GMP-specific phosphodiesterase class I)/GGDEF domain-containing protein